MAGEASRAVAADSAQPLDAYSVADFDTTVLAARTHLDDLADALVAANLTRLRRVGQRNPAVGHDAQIGVADPGVSAVIMPVSFMWRNFAVSFGNTHRLMRTSPAPGSGMSRSTTLVEILPGSS